MMLLPAVTPVTLPDVELTVALPLLLVHVPPVMASLSVVLRVVQTLVIPVIAAGTGLTVNDVVFIQPVGSV